MIVEKNDRALCPVDISLNVIEHRVLIQVFTLAGDSGEVIPESMIKYAGVIIAYKVERDATTFHIEGLMPIKVYNQHEVYEIYRLGRLPE